MDKKLFPLGSVITLKDTNHCKFIIVGYFICAPSVKKIWDYGAYFHPQGMDSQKIIMFNHDSIDQVLFIGFQSKLGEVYIENLLEARSQ